MQYPAYFVQYFVRWPGKKSAYLYQRFYRALYGYTQVVSKASGKRYVYYREGVLTRHPYIKAGRSALIIPDSALQPLLGFLRTGKNPAHRFSNITSWTEMVKYSTQATTVSEIDAANAVYAALSRIYVHTICGARPALALLDDVDILSPDEVYSLYYAIAPIYRSKWFSAFSNIPDFANVAARIRDLSKRVGAGASL